MEKSDFERIAKHFIPEWIQWHEQCREQVIIAMSAVFDEMLSTLDNTGSTYNWSIISERRSDGKIIERKDYADSILRIAYFQKDVWSSENVKAIYSDDISNLKVYNPKIDQEVTDALTGKKMRIQMIDWQEDELRCMDEDGNIETIQANRLFI
jgi:hypothetical protein